LGAAELPLFFVGPNEAAHARALRWQDTLQKLARLSGVAFAQSPPKSSAQFLVRGTLAALPLEGFIDLAAEAKRLDKEIERHDVEAKKLDAKLSNEGFLAKAEEEVIDEHRERRETALARIETLKAARARLG
jgi:valyl-tRNA synthetase